MWSLNVPAVKRLRHSIAALFWEAWPGSTKGSRCVTLQERPSSTATDSASDGFSITRLVCPEKSMATSEFSEMLLWNGKHTRTHTHTHTRAQTCTCAHTHKHTQTQTHTAPV